MNATEDRLKDSFDAIRGMVTADDVPDLEFTGRRAAPRWLVPVTAAAAAAVVVVGGTVALQGHSSHKTVAPSAVPTLPPAAAPPKFYLAAVVPNPIAVYDTATGRRTSTTHIGSVTKVVATGDGRTFFAVSDQSRGEALYRITIDGAGKVTTSTRLSIRQESNIGSLSMDAAGRTVIFSLDAMKPPGPQIRSLDLTLPGRDLTTSRVLISSVRSGAVGGPVALSPDGRYFAVAIEVPTAVETSNVVEYSATTGHRIRVVLNGLYGHSDYSTITFDSTGTNLLISGGGHRISRVPDERAAITLGAPAAIDTESTAAW